MSNYIHNRPLNFALSSRSRASVRLLLDHGCETNYVNVHGWLSLHGCCYAGFDNDIIDIFLEKGLNINQKTWDSGDTPLFLTVQEGHVQVSEHLISRGADVNATNNIGECALHIAIIYNHTKLIQLLLEHKADHTIRTNSLEDILHYAAQFARLESLAVLLRFDLDGINHNDKVATASDSQSMKVKGLTALEIAERRQDVSTEWLDMFRKLVQKIRDPKSTTRVNPVLDEEDAFHDAQEHQV